MANLGVGSRIYSSKTKSKSRRKKTSPKKRIKLQPSTKGFAS